MSDTVKLIIELPIDKYLSVKTNMINDFIYDAVKHGILLDEVKAEIRGMGYHMIDYEVVVSQEEVLDIIDSIGKGETNEQTERG